MTVILYKVAWKPILKALEMRESGIRKAIEDAEKAQAQTARAEQRQEQMLREADAQSQKDHRRRAGGGAGERPPD